MPASDLCPGSGCLSDKLRNPGHLIVAHLIVSRLVMCQLFARRLHLFHLSHHLSALGGILPGHAGLLDDLLAPFVDDIHLMIHVVVLDLVLPVTASVRRVRPRIPFGGRHRNPHVRRHVSRQVIEQVPVLLVLGELALEQALPVAALLHVRLPVRLVLVETLLAEPDRVVEVPRQLLQRAIRRDQRRRAGLALSRHHWAGAQRVGGVPVGIGGPWTWRAARREVAATGRKGAVAVSVVLWRHGGGVLPREGSSRGRAGEGVAWARVVGRVEGAWGNGEVLGPVDARNGEPRHWRQVGPEVAGVKAVVVLAIHQSSQEGCVAGFEVGLSSCGRFGRRGWHDTRHRLVMDA